MAFVSNYGATTIGSSATLIVAANTLRKGSLITNNGSTTMYVGMDSSVTASNGLPITQGTFFNNAGLSDAYRGDIYGIVSSGSTDARWWEFGP